MTTVTLTMPRLGETMEEGTVSDWLVAEGETFERGAPLIEFETDKTAVEYPALGGGRLVKLLVGKGDLVKLGEPIAEIALEGAEDWVSATTEGAGGADESDTIVIDLLMPRLGETMEEGKIAGWLIEPGQAYDRGDAILEVETDKTVAEFPALVAGKLVETLAEAGETIAVDHPIARVEVDRRDAPVASASEATPASAPDAGDARAPAKPAAVPVTRAPGAPIRATPLARRAARRAGLRLETLRGTGRRGRIERADVERALTGGGTELGASKWGPSDGAPVLMVHGFAGDRVTFEQLGMSLGRGGLSAQAVDLPAHGETAAGAETFDDLVASLAAALDPARPVHAVAHSLGAAAIVAAAARVGGVASLTLIAPAGLGLRIDADFVAGMAEARSAGAVGHLLRRLSRRAESFGPEVVAEIHASLAEGRLKALAADICRGGQQAVNVRAELAELAERMPVRVIVGKEDRIVDWQDALDVSPAIALHVFPRAGHMPHWDEPAEVAAIIMKGLADD